MAKITFNDGYSDKNLPAEIEGQLELPFDGLEATETDDVSRETEPVAESGTEEGNYATYTVRDLIRACQARGLSYSGPSGVLAKDELVARLSAQEA